MTAYRKKASQTLKLTRSWVDPHTTSPAISECRAHAFQAAVSKARELGWICLTTKNPARAVEQAEFPLSRFNAGAGAMRVRTTGTDSTRDRIGRSWLLYPGTASHQE
jgi:hypothetical protein